MSSDSLPESAGLASASVTSTPTSLQTARLPGPRGSGPRITRYTEERKAGCAARTVTVWTQALRAAYATSFPSEETCAFPAIFVPRAA